MKIVFVASIIRNSLCIIYVFFIIFFKNHFLLKIIFWFLRSIWLPGVHCLLVLFFSNFSLLLFLLSRDLGIVVVNVGIGLADTINWLSCEWYSHMFEDSTSKSVDYIFSNTFLHMWREEICMVSFKDIRHASVCMKF